MKSILYTFHCSIWKPFKIYNKSSAFWSSQKKYGFHGLHYNSQQAPVLPLMQLPDLYLRSTVSCLCSIHLNPFVLVPLCEVTSKLFWYLMLLCLCIFELLLNCFWVLFNLGYCCLPSNELCLFMPFFCMCMCVVVYVPLFLPVLLFLDFPCFCNCVLYFFYLFFCVWPCPVVLTFAVELLCCFHFIYLFFCIKLCTCILPP